MKKKIICIFAVVVAACLICCGIFGYCKNRDTIKGNWFQKIYGSIGVTNDGEYALRFDLFSFSEEPDFLYNVQKISFDNKAVSISNLNYEILSSENDLKIYAVDLNLKFSESGDYTITKLIYNSENGDVDYSIGNITFICKMEDTTYVQHGCDTNFFEGNADYTFLAKNEQSFVIKGMLAADSNEARYSYDENVDFCAGQDLVYSIHVDFKINKGDIFAFQPVFVLNYEGDNKDYYFTPNIMTVHEDSLTYMDIKEYVKND